MAAGRFGARGRGRYRRRRAQVPSGLAGRLDERPAGLALARTFEGEVPAAEGADLLDDLVAAVSAGLVVQVTHAGLGGVYRQAGLAGDLGGGPAMISRGWGFFCPEGLHQKTMAAWGGVLAA